MDSPAADALLTRLGYVFRDRSLFLQSLTHKSFANENSSGDNERLEFLGDAVLDLVVSDLLYARFPDLPEGDLSKLRAGLVSETSLAAIARELGVGPCLLMGKGEHSSGGTRKRSILSDALEAIVAAIYLDSRDAEGIGAVTRVITAVFAPKLTAGELTAGQSDHKTELQELVQKRYKDTVAYRIISEEGPDHAKQFEVAVTFRDREVARGGGRSKKQAEQAAAHAALLALKDGRATLEP